MLCVWDKKHFQKFSSMHPAPSHCSAMSSCTGNSPGCSCCTISPHVAAAAQHFTPVLIQPCRGLSFQDISQHLTFCSSQDPWAEGRTDRHLKSRRPARFHPYQESLLCPLGPAHQDCICITQKGSSQPVSRKTDQLFCLEVPMQTARQQKPKKNKPKKQPFFQAMTGS